MGQGDDPWAAGEPSVAGRNPVLQPKGGAWRILWGHHTGVVSVAMVAGLDTVVSGSLDGTCLVHSVLKARLLHRLVLKPQASTLRADSVSFGR